MSKVPLTELADVIRSKNAGPYELTFDVIFKSREVYDHVVNLGIFTPSFIAELYGIPEDRVLSVVEYAPALAIKATIARPVVCGDVEDTDVYGAQQHAPLLNVLIPWD